MKKRKKQIRNLPIFRLHSLKQIKRAGVRQENVQVRKCLYGHFLTVRKCPYGHFVTVTKRLSLSQNVHAYNVQQLNLLVKQQPVPCSYGSSEPHQHQQLTTTPSSRESNISATTSTQCSMFSVCVHFHLSSPLFFVSSSASTQKTRGSNKQLGLEESNDWIKKYDRC